MKYRDTVRRRLAQIEGNMKKLHMALNMGGIREEFQQIINETRELASDTSDIVDREPMTPDEINPTYNR